MRERMLSIALAVLVTCVSWRWEARRRVHYILVFEKSKLCELKVKAINNGLAHGRRLVYSESNFQVWCRMFELSFVGVPRAM